MATISIVVPVYYNEASLEELHRRLDAALAEVGLRDEAEFVFVDDGSEDGSRDVLRAIAQGDPRVRCVFLSRNFGSFTAILPPVRGSVFLTSLRLVAQEEATGCSEGPDVGRERPSSVGISA